MSDIEMFIMAQALRGWEVDCLEIHEQWFEQTGEVVCPLDIIDYWGNRNGLDHIATVKQYCEVTGTKHFL